MLQSVEKLIEYTSGLSFDSFSTNSMAKDAVTRNVQVLGEAANKVPDFIKTQFPEVEWNKIIRSRHIVTHDYASVDYEIIWRIATIHAIPLRESLNKILSELEP
jgi:uncharacterized protein with HEPN domain